MIRVRRWMLALGCWLFAACGTADEPVAPVLAPTPVDTPTGIGTPSPIPPTPTATRAPTPAPTSTHTPTATPELRGPLVTLGGIRFQAELAIEPAERTKGLSGRESLPRQTGMLFIFANRRASSFWMKDMQFPLDFVWISEECAVAEITGNVPNPAANTSTELIPTYTSGVPSTYNFEINAGEAAELGVEVGDTVLFTGMPDEVGETCEE